MPRPARTALLLAAEQYEQDCIVTLIDLSVEADAWGREIVFSENDAAHPNYQNCVGQSIEDYKKIQKVDYRNSKSMQMHLDVCKRPVQERGKDMPIVAFVFGPLGVLSMLRGQQDLYLDLYDDPEAVKAAARSVNETLKEYVKALCKTGISAVMLDTLFGSGAIMSKEMRKETEVICVVNLRMSFEGKTNWLWFTTAGRESISTRKLSV